MAGFFTNCMKNVIEESSKYMRNNSTRLQGKKMIDVIINNYIEKKKKRKVKKKSERTLKHSVHGTNVRHAHPKLLGHLRVPETLSLKTQLSTNPLK